MIKKLLNYLAKKIFLRNFVKKIFFNFLKNYRYKIFNDYEITYIPLRYDGAPPNKELQKISIKAFEIVLEDHDNYNKINHNKNLTQIFNFSDHYMLLKGIAESIEAKNIVEIGTASGLSLLSFLKSKFTEHVHTWDLYPIFPTKDKTNHIYNAEGTSMLDEYNKIHNPDGIYLTESAAQWANNNDVKTYLENELHSNTKKFTQFVENIDDLETFNSRRNILEDADIIFIDGPHDGIFEKSIYNKLKSLNFKKDVILILDDIKVSSMVMFWENIEFPKLDITHMGHITGTGIVKLNNKK